MASTSHNHTQQSPIHGLYGYVGMTKQYLLPLRRKALLLALLIFAVTALQLVNPQIIRYFIDTAVAAGAGAGQARTLLWAALTFLGAALLLQGLSIVATYVSEDIGWRATNQLREDLTRHCLHLDMGFHNEHKPGEMIERIDGDVIQLAIFFSQFVIRVLANLLLLLGVLVVMLWTEWRISLALALYSVAVIAIFTYIRKIAVPRWKAAREASADLFGFLEEHLAGTEDLRASGAVPYVMRTLFKFSKMRLDREVAGGDMGILMGILWNFFSVLGLVIAFGMGLFFYRQGALTVGGVYLVFQYTNLILEPLTEITEQIEAFQRAAASIERVEELRHQQSRIDGGDESIAPGPLGIRFADVNFAYSADTPVLQNVTFALAPGRVLGLLGRTGSGKTTLTRLLFRLYDPTSGTIFASNGHSINGRSVHGHTVDSYAVDGRPITDYANDGSAIALPRCNLELLRSRISMVTQDVQLFRGTVRNNITLFNDDLADEKILAVIDDLGLTTWYEKLPNGLDTELADGGGLSAGEAQLLALTRVFLFDPGLVILDEASSRLDPVTEQLIEHAIDKLLENRTGIIVAHRLRTVQRADDILILAHGRVEEHGSRTQLAADSTSRFATLLRTGLEEVLV